MKIEVDENILKRFFICYIKEQEWGDYADECQNLAENIIENNGAEWIKLEEKKI
jgi:hypothetical protein